MGQARLRAVNVRRRTDGKGDFVQSVIKFRSASHGVPEVLGRIGSLSRAVRHMQDVWISERHGLCEPRTGKPDSEKVNRMLHTIAVVLVIMWLLGFVTSYTLGGFIHILLVIALVMILVNFISGRRA
jgi:hypothetical protein